MNITDDLTSIATTNLLHKHNMNWQLLIDLKPKLSITGTTYYNHTQFDCHNYKLMSCFMQIEFDYELLVPMNFTDKLHTTTLNWLHEQVVKIWISHDRQIWQKWNTIFKNNYNLEIKILCKKYCAHIVKKLTQITARSRNSLKNLSDLPIVKPRLTLDSMHESHMNWLMPLVNSYMICTESIYLENEFANMSGQFMWSAYRFKL